MYEKGVRGGSLAARSGISLPAVGRRTSSSIPPFLGVYPNSYKFGCERVMCHCQPSLTERPPSVAGERE